MGRANPQWEHFREQTPILLVFSSPHGYVSPQLYDFTPAAPTLDYATVHLTGDVELIEDRAETMDVVLATVGALEGQRPTQWDPSGSRDLHERIIGGVVAFRVRVSAQQSMFKLSQDMPGQVRAAVRDDFAQGPHQHPHLAALMDRLEADRT
jgi:transcriptional regulator